MLLGKTLSPLAISWVFQKVSGNFKQCFEGRGLFLAGICPLPGFLKGFVCVCFVIECGLYFTTVILFAASNCWLNLVK